MPTKGRPSQGSLLVALAETHQTVGAVIPHGPPLRPLTLSRTSGVFCIASMPQYPFNCTAHYVHGVAWLPRYGTAMPAGLTMISGTSPPVTRPSLSTSPVRPSCDP
jgi:hypothetical protein